MHGCINSSKFLVAEGYTVKVLRAVHAGIPCSPNWTASLMMLLFFLARRFWAGKNRDVSEKGEELYQWRRNQVPVLLLSREAQQHQPSLQQRVWDVQVSTSLGYTSTHTSIKWVFVQLKWCENVLAHLLIYYFWKICHNGMFKILY